MKIESDSNESYSLINDLKNICFEDKSNSNESYSLINDLENDLENIYFEDKSDSNKSYSLIGNKIDIGNIFFQLRCNYFNNRDNNKQEYPGELEKIEDNKELIELLIMKENDIKDNGLFFYIQGTIDFLKFKIYENISNILIKNSDKINNINDLPYYSIRCQLNKLLGLIKIYNKNGLLVINFCEKNSYSDPVTAFNFFKEKKFLSFNLREFNEIEPLQDSNSLYAKILLNYVNKKLNSFKKNDNFFNIKEY